MESSDPTKMCRRCKEVKLISEFHRHLRHKDGRDSYCKSCKLVLNAEWHRVNPGRSRAYMMRFRGANIPSGAIILPPEDARCDSCGTDSPGGRGGWHRDHDHDTGELRGWLCHSCNTSLGHLKDSPGTLAAGLVYLAAHGKAMTTEELKDFLAVYEPLVQQSTDKET